MTTIRRPGLGLQTRRPSLGLTRAQGLGLYTGKKGRLMGDIPLIAWWDALDVTTMTIDGNPRVGSSALLLLWRDKVGGRELSGVGGASPRIQITPHSFALYPEVAVLQFTNRSLTLDGPHGLPLNSEIWIHTVAYGYQGAVSGIFTFGHSGNTPGWNSGRGINFNWDGSTYYYPIVSQHMSYVQTSLGATSSAVIAGRYAEKHLEIWVHGVLRSNQDTSPANGAIMSPDRIVMGAASLGSGNSETRDIIITGPLTEAQRQYVEGYLAWKAARQGGLPVGHPYAVTPPPLPENL